MVEEADEDPALGVVEVVGGGKSVVSDLSFVLARELLMTGIIGVMIALLVMAGTVSNGVGQSEVELKIAVQPRAVFAGGSTNVTCSVARSEQNRWLRMGVTETRDSEKELAGAKAAVTYRMQVTNIPCEATMAYCVLQKVGGRVMEASIPIQVLGCE